MIKIQLAGLERIVCNQDKWSRLKERTSGLRMQVGTCEASTLKRGVRGVTGTGEMMWRWKPGAGAEKSDIPLGNKKQTAKDTFPNVCLLNSVAMMKLFAVVRSRERLWFCRGNRSFPVRLGHTVYIHSSKWLMHGVVYTPFMPELPWLTEATPPTHCSRWWTSAPVRDLMIPRLTN